MGRAPCCDKANVKKGPWSPEEDSKLKDYIDKYGTGGNWIALPQKAGLRRCGKSCRLRWLNYLRPNIKHGEFTDDEDRIICTLFATIGSRWSIIAAQLPGRTDNDIKNYWNTKLKKKLMAAMTMTTTTSTSTSSQLQRKPPPPPFSISHQAPPVSILTTYYNTPICTSFTPFEPMSSSQSAHPFNNSSLAQTPESFMSHMQQMQTQMQYYDYPMNENFLMFGIGSEQSCTSSDGSYSREIKQEDMCFQGFGGASYGNDDSQSFMLNYGSNNAGENVNQWIGYHGECPLDYNVEEDVKRLINSGGNNNCSDNNSFSFSFIDEDNNTLLQEKVMYY